MHPDRRAKCGGGVPIAVGFIGQGFEHDGQARFQALLNERIVNRPERYPRTNKRKGLFDDFPSARIIARKIRALVRSVTEKGV